MTISWNESSDGDFKHYNLLYSGSESGDKTSLTTISNKSTTSHSITEFNPNIENWYWVEVSDTLGQTSIGTGMTNLLNNQPTSVNVTSVTYDLESMTITWEDYVPNLSRINQMNQNTRSTVTNDFVSYGLLQSDSEDGTYTSIIVITDQSTTSHSLTEYDPTQENWFKVKVNDYWGLNSTGNGMTNDIEDSPPIPSVLYPITYNNGFQINWSQNTDDDFQSYKLYESLSEDMSNQTLVYETSERLDNNYVVTGISEDRYYQITTEDVWGLQSTSDIETLVSHVELWGEFYSIENTTELDLYNNQLTGEIPSEIGNMANLTFLGLNNNELTGSIPPGIRNLTNLNYLLLFDNQLTGEIPSEIGNMTNLIFLGLNNNELTGSLPPGIGNLTNLNYLLLFDNQLTGEIPENICDLNINWNIFGNFNISNNLLCPPYPSCIEDYVGYQDTSDCD
jgi:Leucine-rich repeat (LRR) protein